MNNLNVCIFVELYIYYVYTQSAFSYNKMVKHIGDGLVLFVMKVTFVFVTDQHILVWFVQSNYLCTVRKAIC